MRDTSSCSIWLLFDGDAKLGITTAGSSINILLLLKEVSTVVQQEVFTKQSVRHESPLYTIFVATTRLLASNSTTTVLLLPPDRTPTSCVVVAFSAFDTSLEPSVPPDDTAANCTVSYILLLPLAFTFRMFTCAAFADE